MTVIASETNSVPLALTLFGPMQVLIHGRPMPHLRSRKTLWLLALLVLRQDRAVLREWLAGTLWPDADQSRAFTSLRAILSELRGALGDQGQRLQSPDRHTLFLDLTGVALDVRAFDAAIRSQKLDALQQAVTLYRGPLLEGCSEEWVTQERIAREQHCLQALQMLGDAALTAGAPGAAIGYYRRAVSLDPWREASRRGWMEALAKGGDHNAAMQVYREFVELLRSDPHATPDAETTALYARLRTEVHTRTDRQAAVPAAQPGVSSPATPEIRGYLPHSLTELIGREAERIEVTTKLRGARLVTLTGPGGIGKTRLAIEVAKESVEEGTAYIDGVWLVSLEALTEGTLVVPQIAAVLGLREEPGRPLLESLTDYLRTKRLLLVLDNCEHLLDASALSVGHLLRECARLRVLATSREPLGIIGENAWQVPPLTVPHPEHLPQEPADRLQVLAAYNSVQLFAERAQSYQKGFALASSNSRAVAQVCAQLEGIPLAIELAAARVRAMTVEQIAARLHDHLSLLTDGNRVAHSRQQTMRATLNWSYALLSEKERLLLLRLSVFAGGWTLEAAEQVCGEGVLDPLTSLVDKSLVLFEQRSGEVGGRYRLLESVRQYAAEGLQAGGDLNTMRQRHRDWLVMFAEEAALKLNGPEQERWLNRLESEHDNQRATLAWSVNDEDDRGTELRLVGALWQFWSIRGHFSEGRRFLLGALERSQAQEATEARGKALMGAAALALRQGDLTEARELHQQSLSIFRKLGHKRAIASSLSNQGAVAAIQCDYPAARMLLEESLSLHRELDNKLGIATALRTLGDLALGQSDYVTARNYFAESLRLEQQLGNRSGIASTLESSGNLALQQGDYAAAQTLFEESLSIRRDLDERGGVAVSIGSLGLCAKDRGDYQTAHALFAECLSLFQELGDSQGIALTLGNLGTLAYEQGNYERAQTRLEEEVTLLRRSGDRHGIAAALSDLANVVNERGDYTAARALLQESLAIRSAMGNRQGVAESLERLAALLRMQSEAQKAACLWGAADALRKALGTPLPPKEREKIARQMEQAHAVLGVAAFVAAREEGNALPWEQAVAYALTMEAETMEAEGA